MTLFKNRGVAVFLTFVVVIAATLVGVGSSLNRVARDIESTFYAERYLDAGGITRRGIFIFLGNIANEALLLATDPVLLDNHNRELDIAGNSLLSSRESLMAAISARDIQKMGLAYSEVQQAFSTLAALVERLDLSDHDRQNVDSIISSFSGAQNAISESSYNQRVASFMDDASFVARLLRPFVFVTPPQAFR